MMSYPEHGVNSPSRTTPAGSRRRGRRWAGPDAGRSAVRRASLAHARRVRVALEPAVFRRRVVLPLRATQGRCLEIEVVPGQRAVAGKEIPGTVLAAA